MKLTASQIAEITGGTAHGPDVTVDGAAIDSRMLKPGALFVPVVAERELALAVRVESLTVTIAGPVLGALSQTQWDLNQPNYSGTIAIAGGTAPYSNLSVTGLPNGLTAALSSVAVTAKLVTAWVASMNKGSVRAREIQPM